MMSMAWALGRDQVLGPCVSFNYQIDMMSSQCLGLTDGLQGHVRQNKVHCRRQCNLNTMTLKSCAPHRIFQVELWGGECWLRSSC